jgi:hypothetical protein
MAKDNLYDTWAKRNPNFETHFQNSLLNQFTEYGGGSVESMSSKGKIFGSGYELYIYAFFLGLYSNERKELSEEKKGFGHAIQFWGNLDSKKLRKAYPKLREYIFVALIAKTEELDLIVLEKGEITERKAVDFLINTMEEYANYGFYKILEKLEDNPNYFYKNTGFLDMILDLVQIDGEQSEDEPLEEL